MELFSCPHSHIYIISDQCNIVHLVAETKGVSMVCSYDYWRMRGICYSYAVDNKS